MIDKNCEIELDIEEIYTKILETFPDSVFVTDIEGHITHVSQEALELYGFECADELVGRSVFELIAPEDHGKAVADLEKTLNNGSVGHVEYTLLRKDQSRFTGELHAALIRDSNGNPQTVIATVRDITRRKRAEKEKDEILRNLNERVKELSFFYSIDKFIRKNLSIEEIFEKIIYVIPKSWQYPEITECCITYGNKEYKTKNFKATEWMQEADITVDT
ncbi:MAG: PAS domain S-box protein, partial [Theionarchaea archaeon]|nr:PAS domain S-box protein [Theionarchaea archaeon]